MSRSRSRSRRRNTNGRSNNEANATNNGNDRNKPGQKERAFWSSPTAVAEPVELSTPARDPGAMVRSLGPPPLFGGGGNAEHYFNAVYDRSAMLAGALAAASDLLDLGTDDGTDDDQN